MISYVCHDQAPRKEPAAFTAREVLTTPLALDQDLKEAYSTIPRP